MFESIQAYEKEVRLYKTLLRCVIEPREIAKLEEVARYDTDNKKWIVPLFTVGQRNQINFSKYGGPNSSANTLGQPQGNINFAFGSGNRFGGPTLNNRQVPAFRVMGNPQISKQQ